MRLSSLMENTPNPSLITLTERAIHTIQARMAKDTRTDLKLRIYIEGGGCSGLRYEYLLDPSHGDEDILLWSEKVSVISDELSAPYLLGATLDYVNDLKGAKFVVQNPHAEATCGCGSSFTLKE